MTAQCAICKQIITGAPVMEVTPDRRTHELAALARETGEHIVRFHSELIGTFTLVINDVTAYLSTMVLESDSAEFLAARQQLREHAIELVVSPKLVQRGKSAPDGGKTVGIA